MLMKVKTYHAFKYLEVYEIIKWKDGCIFDVKSTNKYIPYEDEEKIDRDKFTTSSVSTSLRDSKFVRLDVESGEFFGEKKC